jgi:ATP synthase protein I
VADALTAPVAAPEREMARHMLRLAVPVAPAVILVSGLVWGVDGALSAGFGIALVLLNLVASAALLTWAAGISPNALMAAALGGFLARMIVVVVAVSLVRHQSWVELVPLGITVLVTNLALLAWESRHVSATLAYPVHKPRSKGA